jgi:hypothetical protein
MRKTGSREKIIIRITCSKLRAKRNAMNKSKNYQEKLNEQPKASSTASKPIKGEAKKASGKLKSVLGHPMTRPMDTSLTKPLPLRVTRCFDAALW